MYTRRTAIHFKTTTHQPAVSKTMLSMIPHNPRPPQPWGIPLTALRFAEGGIIDDRFYCIYSKLNETLFNNTWDSMSLVRLGPILTNKIIESKLVDNCVL